MSELRDGLRRIDALPMSRAAREEAKRALAASAAALETLAAVERVVRSVGSWSGHLLETVADAFDHAHAGRWRS